MSDNKENITKSPYLHLYQKIELLEELLKQSRENSKKWHRAFQRSEKLELENKWLRGKLRTTRDEHEDLRRSHRNEFTNKYVALRKSITEKCQLMTDNLRDKEVGGFKYLLSEMVQYSSGRISGEYERRNEIIHPGDIAPHQQKDIIKTTHMASHGILVKRLIRERDLAYKALQDFMKTV